MKNIVILGSGFGGLRTSILLAKKIKNLNLQDTYTIVLVDKNDYHTYTPTLYEIATTSKEVANILDLKSIVTFPISNIVHERGIRFIHDNIQKIDLIGGDIHFERSPQLLFHYLVIALGSETNYFNTPGVEEYGFELKSFADAIKIREALWTLAEEKKCMDIVIGGGGSTGVEIAGEIEELLSEFKKEIKDCSGAVTIIDSGPRILSQFDGRIGKYAERRLRNLGVKTTTGDVIQKVDKNAVYLMSGKKLAYDIFIWTGGVKAPSLLTSLPLKSEKRGRIEVQERMECIPESPDLKIFGKVYAIGDSICMYDKNGNSMPGIARAAICQATVVAHNICEDICMEMKIKEKAEHMIYTPRQYPYILPVGGKYAIAKFGPVIITGFFAWILKGLVELNYLMSIMPIQKALLIWVKGLKIFVQNDRLG